MGNVVSRTRAYSLDEMGIVEPTDLPMRFEDKQTQVNERLISKEYFKHEVRRASRHQIQNPEQESLAHALAHAFRRRSSSDSTM